jgi:ABC-type nitrate/sulfonate/bicarbonate transport system permease component
MGRIRKLLRRHQGVVTGAAALSLALLAWHVTASRSGLIRDQVASPDTVARAAAALMTSGELARHGWVSLQELAIGFALAMACGVGVGLALGCSRVLSGLLDPLVMALHATPRVALLPMLVVALGVGMASKVAAVFLGAIFPIIVNTQAGVRHVDALWVRATRAFGARPVQVVAKVLLPATLPAVMTGLRLGFGRGVVTLIVAEMYVSLAGVGQLLQIYGNAGRTAELIALATLVALAGSAGVASLRWMETQLSPWRRDLDV